MHRLLSTLTLAVFAGLLATPAAHALDVKLPFGTLAAPDGVTAVNREEKPDKAGKPAGMAIYSRTKDPKAVFILVWNYAEPDPARPYDPLDGAVKIGNPFDKALTRDAAKPVQVGGVDGGRYDGLLPNGQRAVSYVAVKDGYRLVVLMKSPPDSPYQELTEQFSRSVEGFVWSAPAAP
ncbi:hypothetical protein ACG04Q_15525 [Roseateles sp. DXS20W]|uniref:DUF1795 domain-containing protein n=1 Tax=Pelomonas lactea TaxID=3299030 RepID=A0ABW7GM21_9BURK